MNFSQVLTDLMEKRGVTAYKIWKDTGIAQSTIGKWKAGKKEPTAAMLSKIAEYFDVSTDYLLGKEQKKEPADKVGELRDALKRIMEDLTEEEAQKLRDYYELLKAARRNKADK